MTDLLDRRPELPANNVRWRAQTKPTSRNSKTTAGFVAYITQEHLAEMFDQWVGPENWWATFDIVGRNMWCTITVVVDTAGPDGIRQVSKSDVGDLADSTKAATSDSFKRCATRQWGIGREVRHLPIIWATCGTARNAAGDETAIATAETHREIRTKLARAGHGGYGDTPDGVNDTAPEQTTQTSATTEPPSADADPEGRSPAEGDLPSLKWSPEEIVAWLTAHGRDDADPGIRKVELLRMVHELNKAEPVAVN